MSMCGDMYDLCNKAVQDLSQHDPKPVQDEEEIIVATPVEPWVPEGPELDLDELYKDEKK